MLFGKPTDSLQSRTTRPKELAQHEKLGTSKLRHAACTKTGVFSNSGGGETRTGLFPACESIYGRSQQTSAVDPLPATARVLHAASASRIGQFTTDSFQYSEAYAEYGVRYSLRCEEQRHPNRASNSLWRGKLIFRRWKRTQGFIQCRTVPFTAVETSVRTVRLASGIFGL